MAKETRKYYERPITVTPFGVDCHLFRRLDENTNASNEFVVGIVKALEEEYCPDILLRSFALVSQKYRERKKLRLMFAGEGPLRKKLVRLAEDLGVREITDFLGFVPHSRVPEVLNSLSVFVVVSQRESFGVTVLEASACSIPVIVSSVGGLPEVVQDGVTGIIVPPRDVEATAAAISRLIDDDRARHAMGVAGREFVLQNYEWSENAGRMERLYESLFRDRKTVYQPAC
jgi:glycosyltransferase involved in cell wall biosynthesis